MQAVALSLPELDSAGCDAIAAPLRGTRRLCVLVQLREFREPCFQLLPTPQYLALAGGQRAQATAQRPTPEVGVRLLRGDAGHIPLDTHLSVQGRPEEHERGAWVRFQLVPFATLMVRVEDEAALVVPLQ